MLNAVKLSQFEHLGALTHASDKQNMQKTCLFVQYFHYITLVKYDEPMASHYTKIHYMLPRQLT